jgi:histidinol phosphatase-like PHP family hydrolase
LARLYRTDFHVHTSLSDCGSPEATPKAILRAAREAQLEAIGFSDHIIFPQHFARPEKLRAQLPQQTGDLRVYVGCEADITSPTDFSIDADFARTLDFVLMSASHLYVPGTEHPVSGMDVQAMAAYITAGMNLAVNSGLADVVVHPFCVPMGPYDFAELAAAADPDELSRLGRKAAQTGVALEFNPEVLRTWPEAATWLFRLFLGTGVKLAINSDAHHPRNIGCRSDSKATEEEIRAVGVTDDVVWTIEDRISNRVRP